MEEARGDVYAVINTVTALTTAIEHAAAERERAAGMLARLEVEAADLRDRTRPRRRGQGSRDPGPAGGAGGAARDAGSKAAHEADLAQARGEHERRERAARDARARARRTAAPGCARSRRWTPRAPRSATGRGCSWPAPTTPSASTARWPTTSTSIRATSARSKPRSATCCSTWSSTTTPRRTPASPWCAARAPAAAASSSPARRPRLPAPAPTLPAGAVRLSDVVRVSGPFAHSLRAVIGDAVIVPTARRGGGAGRLVDLPVVTTDGDVYRGAHVVSGGSRTEARGILATKREIKDLREGVTDGGGALVDAARTRSPRSTPRSPRPSAAVSATVGDAHRHEKAIVAAEADLQRATADEARVGQRAELVATEARGAREAIDGLDARQAEAQASIGRLADERVHARYGPGRRAAPARRRPRRRPDPQPARRREPAPQHAGLAERALAAVAEVQRLEEAARELSERADACRRDVELMRTQRERLLEAVGRGAAADGRGRQGARGAARRGAARRRRDAGAQGRDRAAGADDPRRPPGARCRARAGRRARRLAGDRRGRPHPPGPAEPRRRAGRPRHRRRRSRRDGAPGHHGARRPGHPQRRRRARRGRRRRPSPPRRSRSWPRAPTRTPWPDSPRRR